jgi:hypothetical protein
MNVTVHMAEAQADQARKLPTVLKSKYPGPEGPALVIPRGDLLCWSSID